MSSSAYPEMALPHGPERARLMALRSFVHCGVIRAGRDHPVFKALWQSGDADYESVRGDLSRGDYRLNKRGRAYAEAVLK